MPRGGAQPGAGRKPGQKDSKPRTRRTPAQFAADKAAAELKVKATTAERMSALEFLSCVVANEEIPGCEQSPPYKFETQLIAAKTLIAYQSPRLASVAVKDDREDQQRLEFIRRIHDEAMVRHGHAAKHGREVAGIIAKLPEDEAAILRQAIGSGVVINGHAE